MTHTPLYQKIYQHLRQAIESGELAPASHIPSNARLARQFGAGICTVQTALAALEREGLIERRQKLGTFVRSRQPRLSRVGLYFNDNFWKLPDMDFYRMLYGHLQQLLSREKISFQLYLAEQKLQISRKLPAALLQDARRGEIQAVIAPLIERVDPGIIAELAVPLVVVPGYYGATAQAVQDYRPTLFRKVAQYFRERNCRRAALFSVLDPEDFVVFQQALEEQDLSIDPAWSCPLPERRPGDSIERIGYEAARERLTRSPPPDGLFLYPDTFARGVIPALLQAGVRIPEQCRLAIHLNEGMRLLVPFPFLAVVTDPAEVALALVRHAQGLVSGHPVPPRALNLSLEECEI